MPENKAADTIVGRAMLDLNNIVESNNQSGNENNYQSQGTTSSDDYISESVAFSWHFDFVKRSSTSE